MAFNPMHPTPPSIGISRFVLIATSHAGNVGAAARAIKTMGFHELVLVAPRWPNLLSREETIQRASGANDVLTQARVVATLDEALDGVSHLCATAMTPRDFGPPTHSPRAYFERLLHPAGATDAPAEMLASHRLSAGSADAAPNIAFLFGSERFGMRNEDVYRCHACLSIPTQPGFGSLNLGAAVQLIAYEWRQALGGFAASSSVAHNPATTTQPILASAQDVAGLLQHWQAALIDIGFLDPQAPKKLMPRLNQLFNRAALTPEEVHILRGIARAMQQRQKTTSPSSQ